MNLHNHIALITGGGRGIGAASARLFASAGAKIVITSRTEQELQATCTAVKKQYPQAHIHYYCADIGEEQQVALLFEKVKALYGPVSLLVNNAATIAVQPFMEMDISTWDRIITTNVRGTMLCSKEAFAHMRFSGKGGVIINISSLGGLQGTEKFPGFSAYVASKYAVTGLTESLAVEGKPYGIRVNCVAPGAVETRMLKEAAPFLETSTTPQDIARVIGFLCDDTQSGKITGSVFPIPSNE